MSRCGGAVLTGSVSCRQVSLSDCPRCGGAVLTGYVWCRQVSLSDCATFCITFLDGLVRRVWPPASHPAPQLSAPPRAGPCRADSDRVTSRPAVLCGPVSDVRRSTRCQPAGALCRLALCTPRAARARIHGGRLQLCWRLVVVFVPGNWLRSGRAPSHVPLLPELARWPWTSKANQFCVGRANLAACLLERYFIRSRLLGSYRCGARLAALYLANLVRMLYATAALSRAECLAVPESCMHLGANIVTCRLIVFFSF